jgi:hypothetical protein
MNTTLLLFDKDPMGTAIAEYYKTTQGPNDYGFFSSQYRMRI